MAAVFLAQDLKHKRPVALKVLLPERAQVINLERFRREIELVARLHHPHILTVLDSGEAAGHPWFTMPYVEGETLRDRLRREKVLSIEESFRIAGEVSRALDYAHRQGIIHRDIKPANILLTRDGDTLVADFGIACAFDEGSGVAERLTESGAAVGTPAYMAPEQAVAAAVLDARIDQYALAVVLFEMLSGALPFTGTTAAALMAERLTAPVPPVRATRQDVPARVDRVLRRALSVDPSDRFATISDFTRALDSPSPLAGRRLRIPGAVAFLFLGALLGLAAYFLPHREAIGTRRGPPVIAVLPFENQGDSADAYFAEGVADEVRSKLTRIAGVTVIARASSTEYRHTTKRPEQIAHELGADYLLTATVQWQKGPGTTNRVRVRPELVEVHAGRPPSSRWGEQFDAAVTDVFDVQANIAERVAALLDLALADSVSQRLAEHPTGNLQAYEAYLRGLQLDEGQYASDPATIRRAIRHYEQAVALDTNFGAAWSRLAVNRVMLYSNTVPTAQLRIQAQLAADRAIALDPGAAGSHAARGLYYSLIAHDNARARDDYRAALHANPEDAITLRRLATLEQAMGQWDSALVHAQRATRLDPRSIGAAVRLAWILRMLRRATEARIVMDRTLALSPTSLVAVEERALADVADGDLAGARAVLKAVPAEVEPSALVAYVATYQDLYWILDDQQRRLLLSLSPVEFDGDRATWALVRAELYWILGDSTRTRSYADTARIEYVAQVKGSPDDAQRHILLGLALAYAGRGSEAVAEAERGVALLPIEQDQINGTYFQHLLARVYVVTGRHDKAMDILERLLKMPYDLTPAWLRVDPNFGPLRGKPRFERMVGGG